MIKIEFTITDEECVPLDDDAEYFERDRNRQAKFKLLEVYGQRKDKASTKEVSQAKVKHPKHERRTTNGASGTLVTSGDA